MSRGDRRCRGRRAVVTCAALTTWCVAGAASGSVLPVYDAAVGGSAVVAPFLAGESPYTGVGRYEGRAACTAFLLATAPPGAGDSPAYAVTSGHCPALPGPNAVLIDHPGVGRVVFNYFADSRDARISVPVARIAYATMKGRDLAVLELAVSLRELEARLVRPWRVASSPEVVVGDPIAIVGIPLWSDFSDGVRISRCRTEGVAPVVIEHSWHWFDAQFNNCRDVLPGSSGSPVLSIVNQEVVGVVGTTTAGASRFTECAVDHPCEPVDGGVRSRPDTNYVTSVGGLDACFDDQWRFDVWQPRCPLDPGTEPDVMPSFIGAVNPRAVTQPIDPVRRTWNVRVFATRPTYSYAMAMPPRDDCRRASVVYSPASTPTMTPLVDPPLPATDGFVFLCVLGEAPVADGARDNRAHATVVVARIDTVPPRLPAQVTISDTDRAWRVRFHTVGDEVWFHAYKFGTLQTRCEDPGGYEPTLSKTIGLPKAHGPYRLCVIPYDAAQNPGRLLERVLP